MNVKNFIIGGIAGGIVDFLLGWVVYGMLLHDTFPKSPCDGPTENMLFIFLGCMSFGFLISWVFSQGEGISNVSSGIKMALGIAVFMALSSWFFQHMTQETMDIKLMLIDVIACMVLATGVGAAVALVNGKMK